MDFNSLAKAALSGNTAELPLSGDSMNTLNELIGKGVFNDKADFFQFVMKAFAQYKLEGGSPQPTQGDIQNVIQNTGVGNSLNAQDIDGKLAPLLTAAFTMAGKNKMGL